MIRRTEKFSFSNGRGQTLAALVDAPESEPLFYGVFAPCFTCTKESHGAHKISRALAERGVGMVRFDMTGLGGSEGDFADTQFTTRIQDIIAACAAVTEAFAPPRLLIGHSISGTAALAAVKDIPSIEALATLGSPRDPSYTIDKFYRNKQIVEMGDMAELTIAGRKIMVRRSFVDDFLSHNIAAATAAYDRKLFVFHAPNDEIAGFDNARTIFERATAPDKELIALRDAATHLLEQGSEDAAFIADALTGWFKTRLLDKAS